LEPQFTAKKKSNLAFLIDNTLLRPDANQNDIVDFCKRSSNKGFASICVNPCWVNLVKKKSKERITTTIGFPLGANSTSTKLEETTRAILDGADEIDMVMNIGKFKGKDYKFVRHDIEKVVRKANGRIVKVIIETGYLTKTEIKKAALLTVDSGAHFVKTSTGFGPRGATVNDIKLIKSCVGNKAGIKASGGIRDLSTMLAMLKAGATRIGTSNGIAILKEYQKFC